jgi:hypothetical protein
VQRGNNEKPVPPIGEFIKNSDSVVQKTVRLHYGQPAVITRSRGYTLSKYPENLVTPID